MKKQLQVLAVVLLGTICRAQTTNQGAILGTVTDPTGAVISGVQLSVRNLDTGIVRSFKTASTGTYQAEFLTPGRYEVIGEAQGFQLTTITGLTLTVGQSMRVDLTMRLGTALEKVTVNSTAATINTESAALGSVIPEQAIKDLPLNGREWLTLASLAPGAWTGNDDRRGVYGAMGGSNYGGPGQASAVGFNGARSNYNSYYVDGADSTDPWYNTPDSSPSLDAIQEFRVETNMYSAQYGRGAGAVMNVVTKSGTNRFHGTGFEFFRNKALDALPYFYVGPRQQAPNYLFNQYGGTVGGPIRRNKSFFFFSLERFHELKAGQQLVGFVPTALEAEGDMSQSINPFSGQPVQLVNPYTGQPIPGNKLPADLINPVGQKIMDIWAQNKPNYPSDPFLNWREFRSGLFTQKKYLGRIDHTFNEKNVLFGNFSLNDYDNENPGDTVYGDKNYQEHNKTMALTYVHTFTPTLLNNLTFSTTWYKSGQAFELAAKNYGADLGMYPAYNTLQGTPRLLMFGISDNYFAIGDSGPYKHTNRTIYVKDNLAWVKKSHTLTVGGDYRREDFGWQYESGTAAYYFGLEDGTPGLESDYGTSGSTFTDLLMGLPNYMYVGLGKAESMPLFRNAFSFFAQDDWKVTHRLTLNLGVRYDYESPFTSANHQFMTIDPNTGLPWYAKGAPLNELSSLSFPYETNGPNTAYVARKTNFSPRIGFALRPFQGNRTVVRGGYGIFYTSENAVTTMQNSWVAPFNGIFNWYPKGFFWPDGQNHWTTIDQPLYQYQQDLDSSPGTLSMDSPYYPTGYTQQYNLTISHDLGGKVGMDIGYVGSRGVNLNGSSAFPPDLLAKLTAAVPTISPYIYDSKGYNSNYNSLQVSAHKDMSNGLYFLAAYTYSHALSQASNDETNYTTLNVLNSNFIAVPVKTYANADFDLRHRFSVSGGWELPFGRGKRFGAGWSPLVNGVFGGWTAQTILALQGGFGFPVVTPSYVRPNRTCDGNLPPNQRSASRWFDYSCFVAAPSETVTDPTNGQPITIFPDGDASANIIWGPGLVSLDVGIHKDLPLTERAHLQIRGEGFNVVNHANLIGPSETFINNASGAEITQARDGRDIQLAVKVIF